jgi:hypothetical protein
MKIVKFMASLVVSAAPAAAEVCLTRGPSAGCYIKHDLALRLESLGVDIENIPERFSESYRSPLTEQYRLGRTVDGHPNITMTYTLTLDPSGHATSANAIRNNEAELVGIAAEIESILAGIACNGAGEYASPLDGSDRFIQAGGVMTYQLRLAGLPVSEGPLDLGAVMTLVDFDVTSCEAP